MGWSGDGLESWESEDVIAILLLLGRLAPRYPPFGWLHRPLHVQLSPIDPLHLPLSLHEPCFRPLGACSSISYLPEIAGNVIHMPVIIPWPVQYRMHQCLAE